MSSAAPPLRILLIADEGRAAELGRYLMEQGARVTEIGSLFAARVAISQPYDCVVLRLASSDTTIDAVRTMRQYTSLPMLAVMPDRGALERIAVLDAGADDSLSSPYLERELFARLGACTRRTRAPATSARSAPVR